MPVSGFAIPSVIVARSGIFSACETSDMRRLKAADHGPSQLFRPAIVPNCLFKQSRTELGAVVSRFFIAAANAGSVGLLGPFGS